MNIFYLHDDPAVAAKAMTNKHIIKMIVESAQLLSTAHRVCDGYPVQILSKSGAKLTRYKYPVPETDEILYKSTHINHPSALWTREASENYIWLYQHFIALCQEYTLRYNKKHKTEDLLADILFYVPANMRIANLTPIRCVISNQTYMFDNDPVKSYRAYYEAEKLKTEEDWQRYRSVIR